MTTMTSSTAFPEPNRRATCTANMLPTWMLCHPYPAGDFPLRRVWCWTATLWWMPSPAAPVQASRGATSHFSYATTTWVCTKPFELIQHVPQNQAIANNSSKQFGFDISSLIAEIFPRHFTTIVINRLKRLSMGEEYYAKDFLRRISSTKHRFEAVLLSTNKCLIQFGKTWSDKPLIWTWCST